MSQLDVLRARQDAVDIGSVSLDKLRETATDSLREWVRGVDADAHMALDIARQNVHLMTALRATQLEHGHAIAGLVTEVADVKAEVAGVKAEVADVKAELAEFKAEVKDGLAEVLRRLPA